MIATTATPIPASMEISIRLELRGAGFSTGCHAEAGLDTFVAFSALD